MYHASRFSTGCFATGACSIAAFFSLVVLSGTTPASAVRPDAFQKAEDWYQRVIPEQKTKEECTAENDQKKSTHPQWSWLPEYKWYELSASPYTAGDRFLGAVEEHALPLAALLATAEFSRQVGWLEPWLGGSPGHLQNMSWRVGDLLGDVLTSRSSKELVWRQFVSNLDIMASSPSLWHGSFLYGVKRTLAYFPLFYRVVPEILWEVGVVGSRTAPINIEPKELGQRIALTFEGARNQRDTCAPPFAHIDFEILPASDNAFEPGNDYERLLLAIESTCRTHGVNRIRFYGVKEESDSGGKLGLYVRLFVEGNPGSLVRLPFDFGDEGEVDWWTTALDSRTLLGVYNWKDQYQLVKAWNHLRGYEKKLVNPLGEDILAVMPAVIQSLVNSRDEPLHKAAWRGDEWSYADCAALDSRGNEVLASAMFPRQSSQHTLISTGENGAFFIDDHLSQRVEWPRLSLLTRAHFDSVSSSSLVGLEMHLPWLPARGSVKLVSNVATSMAYGWLSRKLFTRQDHTVEATPVNLQISGSDSSGEVAPRPEVVRRKMNTVRWPSTTDSITLTISGRDAAGEIESKQVHFDFSD